MISRLRLREARISEIEIATVAMQVLLRAIEQASLTGEFRLRASQ
jgi:hypothetical protein